MPRKILKIPAWAPRDLAEIWEKRAQNPTISRPRVNNTNATSGVVEVRAFYPRVGEKDAIDLLQKLIFTPKMQAVWNALERHEQKSIRRPTAVGCGMALFWSLQSDLIDWHEQIAEPPMARRRKAAKIERYARKLSELLSAYGQFSQFSIPRLMTAQEKLKVAGRLGVAKRVDDRRGLADQVHFGLRDIPDLRTLLQRVADVAPHRARIEQVVRQPNSRNAMAHFYIRTLSAHFQMRYKTPLHSHVKTIVEVIAGAEGLTTDAVRMLVNTGNYAFESRRVGWHFKATEEN